MCLDVCLVVVRNRPRHAMGKNRQEVAEQRKAYSLYGLWDLWLRLCTLDFQGKWIAHTAVRTTPFFCFGYPLVIPS